MKTDRIMKLPKGSFKDSLLKYNLLKLIVCALIIFGGGFMVWSAFYGYFSKAVFLDKEKVYKTTAYIETRKAEGLYYYNIVKESSYPKLFEETLNRIVSEKDRNFVLSYYKEPQGEQKRYILKDNITNEEYDKLFNILKSVDGLGKNLNKANTLPNDMLAGESFTVLFEIANPDNHTRDSIEMIRKARETNFVFMFLTPLIPILGFVWLLASAKHTYKRQQEFEKNMNKK